MSFFEHYKRSLVKTITYRITIIIATFIVTYYFTGEIVITVALVTFTNTINTLLYFIHERVWNTVHWGKAKTK